jgi:predicted DNA binding CopG/RHH family protein
MPVLNESKLLKEIEEWENDNLEDIEKESNLQQDINNFKTENTFFSFSGLQSDLKVEEKNTF